MKFFNGDSREGRYAVNLFASCKGRKSNQRPRIEFSIFIVALLQGKVHEGVLGISERVQTREDCRVVCTSYLW